MSGKRQSTIAGLSAVLYVASFGPVTWLFRRGWDGPGGVPKRAEGFYGPLERWMWDGSGTANDLYWRWHRLWDE